MSRNNGRATVGWREKYDIALRIIGRIHATLGGDVNEKDTIAVARRVVADRDKVNSTLAMIQADVEIACGEFEVELPEPGTKQARILLRNRVLEAEIRRMKEAAGNLFQACLDAELEERHPNLKPDMDGVRKAFGFGDPCVACGKHGHEEEACPEPASGIDGGGHVEGCGDDGVTS